MSPDKLSTEPPDTEGTEPGRGALSGRPPACRLRAPPSEGDAAGRGQLGSGPNRLRFAEFSYQGTEFLNGWSSCLGVRGPGGKQQQWQGQHWAPGRVGTPGLLRARGGALGEGPRDAAPPTPGRLRLLLCAGVSGRACF